MKQEDVAGMVRVEAVGPDNECFFWFHRDADYHIDDTGRVLLITDLENEGSTLKPKLVWLILEHYFHVYVIDEEEGE